MVTHAPRRVLGRPRQEEPCVAWPPAIRDLLARYGDEAAMVAPGHGEPAGREALATTLRLTAAAAP
jgi:hypothetical protein